MVTIPRLDGPRDPRPGAGWVEVISMGGKQLKPYVRCDCGKLLGIGLHSVHLDGTVTASFAHEDPGSQPCGWHEFLKLDGYNGPPFGPGEGR